MKIALAVFLTGLLACSTLARAGDKEGHFALKGAGLMPCKVFVAEQEKKSAANYVIAGWIQGYVSAYNKHTPDTYDITPFESAGLLLVLMKHHCDTHPEDRLFAVLNGILAALHRDRMAARTEMVKVTVENQSVMLYAQTIERMQAELTRRGHYDGNMTGQFSDETKSALIAFQSESGIPATGFPDQRTLWQLLRKQPPAR